MTRAAKPLVIAIFSLLWLIVSIMRVPESIGKSAGIGIDTSWVIALPETLRQDSISGRDFHFTYGPLSQVLAYAGAALHSPWSAIDSLPLVMLAFYAASIVLFASILLLLGSVGWKKCIFIYTATAGLNLFSEPTAFRPLALMLCAVLFYRALRTDSLQGKVAWSAAAGAACFAAQLLTFELGPYGVVMAAFVSGVLLIRKDHEARPLGCLSVLVTVYVVANLNLNLLFFLSSRRYHFFDYQHYTFEMIRGFTFSQTLPWELAAAPTLGLALAGVVAIGAALFLLLKSDSKDIGVLLPLLVCSLIQLKSATVRSDLGHITQAGSPLIFILVLTGAILFSQWRVSKAASVLWVAAFATLWFSWPWAGLYFGSDLVRAVTRTSPVAKFSLLRTAASKPSEVLPEGLVAEVGSSAPPMLAFPYQNYIPIALQRRIVAPVLMSYNAGTEALQELYIANLERERNLDVVYGMDNVASTAIDDVQAITRVPLIFDYLYNHFRLLNDTPHDKGFYVLQRDAASPRGFDAVEVVTKIGRAENGAMEVRPQSPVACNLLRLNVAVDYPITRHLGRPTPLELLFFKDGAPFFKTVVIAIKSNAPFSTYVSLIPANRFHDIFGTNPIPPVTWDNLQITPRASDWLGVSPSKVDIQRIECLVVGAGGR
jgi:hypothetical protein